MADELGPDMGELWRNQPFEPVRISMDDLRRKALQFEARITRWFRFAVALLFFLAAGYGFFLYFFPGTLQRIGSSLAVAGFLYGGYELYRRGPARKVPAGPALATCAAYRAELDRQRRFCLSTWSRLLAFVPGPVIFVAALVAAEHGKAVAVIVAAGLVIAPFALGIPLNARQARKLQLEIRALDALTGQSVPEREH